MSVRPDKKNNHRWRVQTGRRASSRGFSMLEFMVAMIVLGIALTGLFPLLVHYSRQVQQLENCTPQSGRWTQPNNNKAHNFDRAWTYYPHDPSSITTQQCPDQWYLAPSSDPWMWKLGAAASRQRSSPTFPANILPSSYSQNSFAIAYLPSHSPSPPDPSLVAYPGSSPVQTSSYGESDAGWISGPPGYRNNSRRHPSASSSAWAATWTFTNVQPGWYVVEATWPDPALGPVPPSPDDSATASLVHYQILDAAQHPVVDKNNQPIQGAANQTRLPSGDTWDSVNWQPIMTAYVRNAGAIQVGLQVPTTPGFVAADGMRLVPVANQVSRSVPLRWTVDAATGAKTVTADVTVTPLRLLP